MESVFQYILHIYLSAILLLIGGVSSLFASILDNLTQDDINQLETKSNIDGSKIEHLYVHHEKAVNGIYHFEVIAYLLSAGFLVTFLFESYLDWINISIFFLVLLVLVYLQRMIMLGIGKRFTQILATKLFFILNLVCHLGNLVGQFNHFILSVMTGIKQEEIARDEINALFETAKEDGSIDEDEYRIMKNVMHFGEVLVSDVMTPRTVVSSLEADFTIGEVVNLPELQMYSRFPIWEGKTIDDGVIGYVMTKDILNAALKNQELIRLREIAREINFIPENAALDDALEQFLKQRQHMFLVVDEYGQIDGILTMEDVMENIIGAEIVDEADKVVDLRELAKQRRDKRIQNIPLTFE
jgi:CBS domain containing-hemolysin-like protein